jgi:hypothetical protein
MAESQALRAAREQLAYWKKECEAARLAVDEARIAQCERFTAQCELMIVALTAAKQNAATP